jgi:SpoVK/Ycf46/Vps4 family AAA+-type ATPase
VSVSRHFVALVRSHVDGDADQFYSTALAAAALEAQQGHGRVARELQDLVEQGRAQIGMFEHRASATTPLAQPRGELAELLTVQYPDTRLLSMTLENDVRSKLERVLREERGAEVIRAHGLQPRRKLLLAGPPGSGKTMTASAIAGELKLPLFTVVLESVFNKYLGESANKLRVIFQAIARTKAVYLFDEFDAIGSKRAATNDIGEIRRVLNAFLQLLEQDSSQSVIIAATNHPELLDRALFRRFDDMIEYGYPQDQRVRELVERRLAFFDTSALDWNHVIEAGRGLSQADIVRSCEDAAKDLLLDGTQVIHTAALLAALQERRPLQS